MLVTDLSVLSGSEDCPETVRAHDQRRTEIHLRLTAIAPPGNNGYELAKTVFQTDPNLKVLFEIRGSTI